MNYFSSSSNFTNNKIKLFCFPYAGSSAVVTYKFLIDTLPEFIEVCPIELPGRGARISEKLIDNLSDILDLIIDDIKDSINSPYIFLGHSMGALISYELTHKLLSEYNSSPLKLYVSAHRAPNLPKDGIIMHELGNDEFINELRLIDGLAAEILQHPELLDLLLPIIRNDYKLCETYNYEKKEKLDIPISVFGGIQDKDISKTQLMEWSDLTTAEFNLKLFDSDHFFILKQRDQFSAEISLQLEKDYQSLVLSKN